MLTPDLDPIGKSADFDNPAEAQEWKPDPRIAILQSESETHEAKLAKEKAWESIYSENSPAVIHYAETICGSHVMAEDIAQDVFIKVFSHINTFDEEGPNSFKKWLTVMTRNKTMDYFRPSEYRRTSCSDKIGTFQAERLFGNIQHSDPFTQVAFHDSLEGLRKELRPAQYSALLLSVLGLTPQENADHHDKSLSSIHGLIHRGRSLAQTALENTA